MEVNGGKGRRPGLTRSARISIFVNVVLICMLGTVLAFSLIWLIARIAWKNDLRVDLTRDERFSVDPVAVSVLRSLKAPVHATFVYGIDDEIRSRALDLARRPREDILDQYYRPLLYKSAARVQTILGEWSRVSELFTFDSIDADRDPQRMTDVAQRRGKVATDLARGINQVVFEMGGRKRTVPMGRMFPINWGFFSPDPRVHALVPELIGKPRVQSELTETLRALAAGEAVKIGIPSGIASAIPQEGREWEALRDFLAGQGFDPAPFDLGRGVPADVALVAIIGAGRKLLADELAALKVYEEAGGRIVIFADPRKPEDFRPVLDPFGVQLEAAVVEDPRRAAPSQRDPTLLLSNELCAGNHEIDRSIARRIAIYAGMSRPLRIENLGAPGAERTVLLLGSNDAKSVPVEFREQSGEPEFVWAAKKSAPNVPIAAVLERPASGKESRVVVFGSWEIISPRFVELGTHYGNRDLVLNTLNWIAERHAPLGIVERELEPSRVEITHKFLAAFRWITIAALPALLLLGGVAVWLSRRT